MVTLRDFSLQNSITKQADSNSNYFDSVHCLRGIAAFVVLMFHSRFVFEKSTWQYQTLNYFAIGVQVFFIISGFVLLFSLYKSKYAISYYSKFLLKRIIRIEPLYIIALLFAVGQTYYHASYYNHYHYQMEWNRFFSHFAYLTVWMNHKWWLATFWTLAIEFQFYIIIGLIFPWLVSANRNVALLSVLLMYSTKFISSNKNLLFAHIEFFVLGILLFQIMFKIISKNVGFFLIIIILSLAFSKEFTYVPALASALSIGVIYHNKFHHSLLKWLGDISYPLYLTHNLFTIELWKVIEKIKPNYWHKVFTFPLVFTIASLFLAWFLHILFEKYFIQLSKKIRYQS